jgi:NTP pyrophosphatase (non-canonical NTP hydrolase)
MSNDAFYQPINDALGAVQSRLDAYQRVKFTERPAEFFSLELCGEAGELANLEKKRWKGKVISHDALSDEAADVLIALMNYANARGVDLGAAVTAKLHRIEEKRSVLAARGEEY